MGFEVYCFPEQNTVLTRVSGDICDDDLFEHLTKLEVATKDMHLLKSFADCRGVTNISRMTTRAVTVAADMKSSHLDCLFALLIPSDDEVVSGLARAFQIFSEGKYKDTKIFTSLDECLDWMVDNADEKKIFSSMIENTYHADSESV